MTNKVVTITLNPALDLTGSLSKLNTGEVSLVESSDFHAAGKGVNVAQVLSDLGAEVTVTGFLGQDNQELFTKLFNEMNAIDAFVRVEGSTRINVKLVEQNGSVSDINFPGVNVGAQAIEDFDKQLEALMQDHDFFVLAGSAPKGVTTEHINGWIHTLRSAGKKVIFDSSRNALVEGVKAKPWMIKPNEHELSDLVGSPLHSQQDCLNAANTLTQSGIDNIVVSMGEHGVTWLADNIHLSAKPPRMEVVSTVGAGDTLVAGFCWGQMQSMPAKELLSFATALSAHAVEQIGVGAKSTARIKQIQQQVELISLSTEETNQD
ncbi:1-phosphofructokinase [Vibrio paucivorans]|uniref:Phosphofructokinase n=1 Tax=Vibrio paucivorans TaxID=2829489 RepID=A0A9X3CGW9_9VIBR|nr:1-phosphofructokinase [Vibrio paucivorans]MCW8335536.1 1-phosphofructokinase [Vibrio paucivorans]